MGKYVGVMVEFGEEPTVNQELCNFHKLSFVFAKVSKNPHRLSPILLDEVLKVSLAIAVSTFTSWIKCFNGKGESSSVGGYDNGFRKQLPTLQLFEVGIADGSLNLFGVCKSSSGP